MFDFVLLPTSSTSWPYARRRSLNERAIDPLNKSVLQFRYQVRSKRDCSPRFRNERSASARPVLHQSSRPLYSSGLSERLHRSRKRAPAAALCGTSASSMEWSSRSPREVSYRYGFYDYAVAEIGAETADMAFADLERTFPKVRKEVGR